MNDFDTFRHEAKAALRMALQWFLLAVPMGLLCGFLGTLFHLAVEHATELRAAQPWLLFLLPAAGLLITALYKVTKCEGVGTNNVLRAVQSGEPVSILLVPAIFLGTVLTHLCGGSAGREGAALQMGGSIGWNLGTLLRLKDHDRRTATISGMAAFFSALFGTPLAAACFAMMVEDVGLTFTAAFVPAFTSALIAYGCSLVFGIAPTHFALTAPELNVRTALLVILLGVACAAVSRLFCYTLHFMEHTVPKLLPNPWVRVFAGGVLVIGLTLLVGNGDYNGAGMEVVERAMSGQVRSWAWLLKLLFTAVTIGFGFKGGEVVPSFFVGACFGCVLGGFLGLPAGFGAAIGLVAVFCGAVNCPIASVFLSIELFGTGDLLYFAMACAISYLLSGYCGLYSSQTILYSKMRAEFINIHTNENEEKHG